jgi:hypothetical protein
MSGPLGGFMSRSVDWCSSWLGRPGRLQLLDLVPTLLPSSIKRKVALPYDQAVMAVALMTPGRPEVVHYDERRVLGRR